MSNKQTTKAGRPSVVNEDMLRKLEVFIASGMSVSASCYMAGLSKSTYYEHKELDREFADRMRMAEEWSTFRARQIILQAIDNGDTACARWYLERKARFEFAPNKAL